MAFKTNTVPHIGEILFVDPGVPDLVTILGSLRPGVEAIVLDRARPASRQIATALADRDVDTVHVIAHGAPGRVSFAAGTWSAETIDDEAADFAAIGAALGVGGELRLWSCDTGADTAGALFVERLAQATGVDIATAPGRVGAAALGGGWNLTSHPHLAPSQPPLTAAGVAAYAGVLASVEWDGGVSGSWTSTGIFDWSTDTVPVAGDDVTIPASAQNVILEVSYPTTGALDSLTLSGGLNIEDQTLSVGGAITNSGTIEMLGGTLNDTDELLNSGLIEGYGTVFGTIFNEDQIIAEAGTLTLQGEILPTGANSGVFEAENGTLHIHAAITAPNAKLEIYGSNLSIVELDGPAVAGDTATFLGTAGTLQLTSSSSTILAGALNGFVATIAGLNVGASNAVPTNDIDLSNLAIGTINSVTLSGSTIIVNDTGGSFALDLVSAPAAGAFVDWITDGGSGTDIFLSNTPCYCRGTLILTELGERPVEDLAIGDRVATRAGLRPIKWVGRSSYDPRFIRGQKSVLPVVISAGALAHGVPSHDLWVSPEHALHLDGALVPARLLVNGMTITQIEAVERLEYFHIELDSHDVILAEGAPAETYIECDNRLMFHNAAEFAALYPKALPRQFCAPRLEEGAAALTAIHTRLLQRAAALGHLVTGDPALHLIADGVAILPLAIEDGVYRFTLERPAEAICLASRSAVPAETDAGSTDRRRLGVCLRRITLRAADLALDLLPHIPQRRDGFHEAEGEHRWTAGMARLPANALALFSGPLSIEIALWPSELRYPEQAHDLLPETSARALSRPRQLIAA